ncbi:serine hydrolase [Robinsoniella peoriensis]|uniref:serine hydrolase n=1 Tax=Robinsoniella peoriensis TaxID=180332 RepID=UPI00363C4FDA
MIKDKEALLFKSLQCLAVIVLAFLLGSAAYSEKTVYTVASGQESDSLSLKTNSSSDSSGTSNSEAEKTGTLELHIYDQITEKITELQELRISLLENSGSDSNEMDDTDDAPYSSELNEYDFTEKETTAEYSSSTTVTEKAESESEYYKISSEESDTDSKYQIYTKKDTAVINSSPETEPSTTEIESIMASPESYLLRYSEEPSKKSIPQTFDLRVGKEAGLTPLYLHKKLPIKQTWEEFEGTLTNMLDSFAGDWGLYLKNLKTGDVISINEHPMESASLIKLYIMGTVYQHIADGTLEKTETIDRLLNDMITVSDNESSNELVRSLSPTKDHSEGMKMVNEFIQKNGFKNTKQVNGLADPSLWVENAVNQTSPADCGKLLEKIYKGKLVSHLASRSMEDLLLNQKITYKIPAGLPESVTSANKTGEVSNSENDAAIVYSNACDYILCIMSTDLAATNSAVNHINSLSSLIYDYFNE